MIRADTEGEEPVTERSGRYWEVDAARAVAIAMMVVYHLVYDLEYFGDYPIESTSGFWARFSDATASAFLFLVGVSLAISYSRAGYEGRSPLFRKYLLRGIRILAYGMALTAVFLLFGMGVIAFGVLHLIGVSIILAYPLLEYRYANLFLGLFIIVAGVYMGTQGLSWESPWLLPFGVVPESLVMPDYRPLLPWFGVVLLGVFAGNSVYGGGRRPALFAGKAPAVARPLLPFGRNSLFFYFIHQPILIALLATLGVIEAQVF